MKKIFKYMLMSVFGIASLASCSDDRDANPTIQDPTAFVLNTPATADQYVDLGRDKDNGTVNFTFSQPDYGYAAAATYNVQVSLQESFDDMVQLDGNYAVCDIDVPCSQIAEAVCKLRGVTGEDDYTDEPARKVYFRIQAQVMTMVNTIILSNVVALNQVKGYFALKQPGYIFLVGAPEGWAGPTEGNKDHYAAWKLYENKDQIGSKIYSGVFDIPAGKFQFRFYTKLTGWESDSYGIQVDDNPIEIALEDGKYEGALVKGKGSFQVSDWAGGSVKITVNMSDDSKMKVKFEAGGVDLSNKKFIYLVGAPEGWSGPDEGNMAHYEDWKLYDMADNGIYSGTFDIPEGKFQFRFYTKLTGWDGGDSYGSQVDDAPVDIAWAEGMASAKAMTGKGSWQDPSWTGGKVYIEVDTNKGQVTFEQK